MIPVRTLTLALLCAGPAVAQVAVTGTTAINSQYQWRGVTTTNRPVVQPQLTVATPLRRGITLAATAFASAEAGRYDDPNRHISENGGAHAGLAEYDMAIETAVPVHGGRLTLGAQRFFYPNATGTTAASNTTEAYARADFALPLAPTLVVYHDVDRVRGTYIEGAVSRTIAHVSLAALAGVNFGQTINDGSALGYFSQRGITHADLSASTSFTLGGITASPSVHVIRTNDLTTRLTAPSQQHALKVWVGTSLSVGHVFRGRREDTRGAEGGTLPAAGTQDAEIR